MLLTAAAEKARRGRKGEIVLVEKRGLVSVTEIIVLQRILEGTAAVETVCFGVAVVRTGVFLPPLIITIICSLNNDKFLCLEQLTGFFFYLVAVFLFFLFTGMKSYWDHMTV